MHHPDDPRAKASFLRKMGLEDSDTNEDWRPTPSGMNLPTPLRHFVGWVYTRLFHLGQLLRAWMGMVRRAGGRDHQEMNETRRNQARTPRDLD